MAATRSRLGRGRLDAELTSFVDRRGETAQVRRLLESARLVTLTGVGGAGKTRLALRVAQGLQRSFPHGAWQVDLAASRDPALLAYVVAQALDVDDQSDRPVLDVL